MTVRHFVRRWFCSLISHSWRWAASVKAFFILISLGRGIEEPAQPPNSDEHGAAEDQDGQHQGAISRAYRVDIRQIATHSADRVRGHSDLSRPPIAFSRRQRDQFGKSERVEPANDGRLGRAHRLED